MIEIYPVIGMSPGNSHFKDEVVKQLLKKVVDRYGKTSVLIPDIPAISTYIALGYAENRARRDKALPQGNNLRNKVARSMVELNYTPDHVKIIPWLEEVENNTEYNQQYEKIRNLYSNNDTFREAAHVATRDVLDKGKPMKDMEKSVKVAVHYLLSEIAFMEFARSYLQAKKVVYIYHRNWPVYEKYISGEFDSLPKAHLGFEIIN